MKIMIYEQKFSRCFSVFFLYIIALVLKNWRDSLFSSFSFLPGLHTGTVQVPKNGG